MRARRGARLGKYVLETRVGAGAFSEVWRAHDPIERRRVALKLVPPSIVRELGKQTVEHEARVATRLTHAHVMSVRHADWIDGLFVLTMELAKSSLFDYGRARRSTPTALRLLRQIASGLAYAHSKGVMHRDIKPENVLILDDGRAVLSDFGHARARMGLTLTRTYAGTIGYTAPEQAYGRPRLASDVFSFGMVAYQLLSGELPTWPFEWPLDGHDRLIRRVPPSVVQVIRRMLELDPTRRFEDAVMMNDALEHAIAQRASGPATSRASQLPPALHVQAERFATEIGEALDLRFRCHRCEGPIGEAMRHCPWCGSADNSFRGTTDEPLYCPDCERGVRPEWHACPYCAARLSSNGQKPPPDPLAARRCSTKGCAGQLRPFMRYCPMCKRKPRKPWRAPALPDRCPRCDGAVSLDYFKFCPWCGRKHREAASFRKKRRSG